METFITAQLSGWGRFPVERCHVFRPEKKSAVAAILALGRQHSFIPRGLGRSYGDAALNRDAGVISHVRLNRFLSFDSQRGVLSCEAGVSFAEILRFFLSRGFFPPVTPGTKFVTVGGAIAADVHGKNHHREGTIANFVEDLELLLPTGEILTCSPTSNSEIFWATVGGMGLTGVILSARVRLRRVETAYVIVDYQKARNIDEALDLFGESDKLYQYSAGWVDSFATGRSLGRAVLMRGNHATVAQLPQRLRDGLTISTQVRWAVPFDPPNMTLNRLTIGAFNRLYYALHSHAEGQLVGLNEFFYPLDAIDNWNRLYGRRGFVQYQFAVPLENGRQALIAVMEQLVKYHRRSFLTVLKRFGEANPGLLSFPFKGYTLTLDLPVISGLASFLRNLDDLVIRHGGRVYLAKDALLRPDTFAAMYPRLAEFRAIKQMLDPTVQLSSSLARRLGIVSG